VQAQQISLKTSMTCENFEKMMSAPWSKKSMFFAIRFFRPRIVFNDLRRSAHIRKRKPPNEAKTFLAWLIFDYATRKTFKTQSRV